MRCERSDRSETMRDRSRERKSLPVALRKESSSTFCLHACSMTTKGCYPSLWPPSDFASAPPSTVANAHTSFHLHTSLKGTSLFPNSPHRKHHQGFLKLTPYLDFWQDRKKCSPITSYLNSQSFWIGNSTLPHRNIHARRCLLIWR
jgi:hypothetical protein